MSQLTVDSVECFLIQLPAIRSFAISGGTVTTAGGTHARVLVRVSANGITGWGEATPAPMWSYETAESIISTIRGYLAPALIGRPAWDIDGAVQAFDRAIHPGYTTGMPIAKSAVDMALHDLAGRALGMSVGALWGQRRVSQIPLAWIVSGGTPQQAADETREGLQAGYRAFKLKVGLGADTERVAAIRSVAPQAPLWIDANQGLTLDEALALVRKLEPFGVAVLEQPLRANDPLGCRQLRSASTIPIALDESLVHPRDLATFIRLEALDIAIAKVQRTAGLYLSRRLCALAEDNGIGLAGSGLTDSALGFAASLHLFAAFGITRPADLNGPQFVRSPYVASAPAEIRDGMATVPTGPGLGVDVDEDFVRGTATQP